MRGISSWLAVVIAAGFIVIAIVFAVNFWGSSDAGLSLAGWAAMILGVLVTLAVGIGLMALVFYSSRRGYDEPGSGSR